MTKRIQNDYKALFDTALSNTKPSIAKRQRLIAESDPELLDYAKSKTAEMCKYLNDRRALNVDLQIQFNREHTALYQIYSMLDEPKPFNELAIITHPLITSEHLQTLSELMEFQKQLHKDQQDAKQTTISLEFKLRNLEIVKKQLLDVFKNHRLFCQA